jgi:hypothetical protein
LKKTSVYAAVAVVAVIVILAVAFALSQSTGMGVSSSTPISSPTSVQVTSSFQAGNQTYIATMVRAPTTSTTLTSTTSTGSASSTSSWITTTEPLGTGDSYTYSASSQVKILTVAASVSQGQNGDAAVNFQVQYENIGSGDIYVLSGGGSNLNVAITSGASILNQVSSPRCEIAVAMTPLSPGANRTAVTPGCWSGFYYQILQPGTIQVELTLTWSNGAYVSTGGGGSLVITADFTLS